MRLLCPADLPGVALSIAVHSPKPQPRHVHDSLVLGVVLAGLRRISTPAQTQDIPPGGLFALAPGTPHACAPEGGPCSYIALSIAADRLPPGYPAVLPLRPNAPDLALLLPQLAEACENGAHSLERQSMLAEALERLAGHAGADAPPRADDALDRAVRTARELLERGEIVGGEGLSLPELAQACEADMYALHRAFSRIVGLPPHAYLTHLRLRRAKKLLREGAGLSDAALEAGFCDQSHMNRHFARIVGLTPAQYARAHRRG